MNNEAAVSDGAWSGLVSEAPEIAIKADSLFVTLAEAARRYGVMVSITVTPYEADEG